MNDSIHAGGRKLRCTPLSASPKGFQSILVQASGFRPLAIVSVYVVPASSPTNRGGRHWRSELLRELSDEVRRLEKLYQDVVVAGDFNGSLGNVGRVSADTGKGTHGIVQFVKKLHLRSVFGSPDRPGILTSTPICRSVGDVADDEGSESDYIFVSGAVDPSRVKRTWSIDREDCSPAKSPVIFPSWLRFSSFLPRRHNPHPKHGRRSLSQHRATKTPGGTLSSPSCTKP